MTGIIPLTKGYVALVDDQDYEYIIQFKWHPSVRAHTVYAQSTQLGGVLLHRIIMNPAPALIVHHKDKNGLNCQRENLVVITQSQNLMFTSKKTLTKNKYKGVYSNKYQSAYTINKFYAQIRVRGKRLHLGMFPTEEEAALAYNRAARLHYGDGNFEPNVITSNQEGESWLETAPGLML